MRIEEALYKQLSTATLTTSLGSTNIYPMVIPQGSTLPAVVYQEVSQTWIHAMQKDPGLRHSRYQISSFATSFSEIKVVSDKVRQVLQDFSSNLGGSVNVQRIFFENSVDFQDIDPETKEVCYHTVQDYTFWITT